MSGNSNKLIAFNYFGGKFTWVEWLYRFFPAHVHFVDVFCGSMAVTLNKQPSMIDTANDINSDVVHFFRVLRNDYEALYRALYLTPVSREEYNQSWHTTPDMSDVERARRFYIRVRQSFYGLGIQRKNKGWCITKTVSRTNRVESVNKWINAIEKLPEVVEKLRHIQIENDCFRNLIPKMDFNGAFFYEDPPYPYESRASKNDYKHDFTNNDHIDLADINHRVMGKVMISSYDCPLMRELYHDWDMIKFPQKRNNIRSGMVQECIWMNYEPKPQSLTLFN